MPACSDIIKSVDELVMFFSIDRVHAFTLPFEHQVGSVTPLKNAKGHVLGI